jgi:FdhD protein
MKRIVVTGAAGRLGRLAGPGDGADFRGAVGDQHQLFGCRLAGETPAAHIVRTGSGPHNRALGIERGRAMDELLVRPDPDDPRLTRRVTGIDQDGRPVEAPVVVEKPFTLFLNGQEIVTTMTIGDHPECLALGYLINQNMLRPDDQITGIDVDDELGVVVVRTERETDYEEKLKKKVRTSGCAVGTVFGDVMESFEEVALDRAAVVRTSWLYALTRKINTAPSLYLEAGAIHGCVLCEEDRPLVYMEDVGRHNAVDKIAGYMFRHGLSPAGKSFYTTGRLTSEMVIKTVQMRIPILMSRSGFTAWGVELARRANLTLIGRAKGKRFLALSGEERIVFDADTRYVPEEARRFQRKASLEDDAA